MTSRLAKLIKVRRVATQCVRGHGGVGGGQSCQAFGARNRKACECGHDTRAIHERQAFFGAEHQRR